MDPTTVVIAGAGPTGLMLACELALRGVPVELLDRLPGRTGQSRAGGIHSRSLEILDQRGLLPPFLEAGRSVQAGHFAGLWTSFDSLPTRYPHSLLLLQTHVERLLEERAAELGVKVRFSHEVVGFEQDDTGVDVRVRAADDEQVLRAGHLVGCDGGRSAVRKLAGIDFPGTSATMRAILGDVELTDPPEDWIFLRRHEFGDISVLDFEAGWYRVLVTEHDRLPEPGVPATFDDLRAAFHRLIGHDFGMHSPRWVSGFSDVARQAERYRNGRVLLAGDAAHIHFPAGGQGLNLGLQDAMNLGWKLAAVARGFLGAEDLDTYHDERHPAAERVLHNTRAQAALTRPGPHTDALREILDDLLRLPEPRHAVALMLSALDVHYGSDPRALPGARMPDVELVVEGRRTRMAELLHTARFVLLDFDGRWCEAARRWRDHVDVVSAELSGASAETWSLPGLGEVAPPSAVLLRPDGHIAWVADGDQELSDVVARWCGDPR